MLPLQGWLQGARRPVDPPWQGTAGRAEVETARASYLRLLVRLKLWAGECPKHLQAHMHVCFVANDFTSMESTSYWDETD